MQAEGEKCRCEACAGSNEVAKRGLSDPSTVVVFVVLVVASLVLICVGIFNGSAVAWLYSVICVMLAAFLCSGPPISRPKWPTLNQVHSWSGFLAVLAMVASLGYWILQLDDSTDALPASNLAQTVFAVLVLIGLAARTMSRASDVDTKSKSCFEAIAEVALILGALGVVIATIR